MKNTLPSSSSKTTATPTSYRNSSGAVYRSLAVAAAPAQLSVQQQQASKQLAHLNGPTVSNKGEVFWDAKAGRVPPQYDSQLAAAASSKAVNKDANMPLAIPLILAQGQPLASMIVQSNPVDLVVREVHALFESHHVDTSFVESDFKWYCTFYSEAQQEVSFACKMFSVAFKENVFVLDFHRRTGDAVLFLSMFKRIHHELLKTGFVVMCTDPKPSQNAAPPPMRAFKPKELPADFFSAPHTHEEEEDEDEDSSAEYDSLMQMCTSPFQDVARSGLNMLIGLLQRNPSARVALASSAAKLVQIIRATKDNHSKRIAMACLACMAQEHAAHADIVNAAGVKVMVQCLFNEDELLETRRQAAKGLCRLARVIPKGSISGTFASRDKRLDSLMKELHQSIAG